MQPNKGDQVGLMDDRQASMAEGTRLYEYVYDLLEQKIIRGELKVGVTLREVTLANVLGMSRAPVRQALELLHTRKLIQPNAGQGYVVGYGDRVPASVRLKSLELKQILTPAAVADINRSATWERIYGEIRDQVVGCLPFGTYRINETEMAKTFSVSRTVVREVLGRLSDRRLVGKDRRSHWIAGPLTAREIRESFEMCRILQPATLQIIAHDVDRELLAGMIGRLREVLGNPDMATARQIEAIEIEFHRDLFANISNKRLTQALAQNRVPLTVPRIFRANFGLKSDMADLERLQVVVSHIEAGAVSEASDALNHYLDRFEKSMMAKLRVISVLPKPDTPNYLINIG